MGFLDKLKGSKSKIASKVKPHEDKIDTGIDKAADLIDDKTGHKHTEKIEDAAEKAKDAVDKLIDD